MSTLRLEKGWLRGATRRFRLRARLASPGGARSSLRALFADASDDEWYWALTKGRRQLSGLAARLPLLPPPQLQAQYTGLSGDAAFEQAFGAVELFRSAATRRGLALGSPELRLVDFGCGWGRITQVFLRDFEPDHITAVDVSDETLALCRDTRLPCPLLKVDPEPPIDLPDESVDLVTAYSVFSHLAEPVHWAWLQEFHRILRPGGVVAVTTRPREFIDNVVALRAQPELPDFARGAAASFLKADEAYARYDAGEYCFDPAGSGGGGREVYYGEALIPRGYVERRWTELFDDVEFVDHLEHGRFDQNLLVAQKAR